MKKKPLPALSAAEQSIMGILWRRQRAGVLELLDEVNAGRAEPVTRTTLQTQLARLEAKSSECFCRKSLHPAGWGRLGNEGRIAAFLFDSSAAFARNGAAAPSSSTRKWWRPGPKRSVK